MRIFLIVIIFLSLSFAITVSHGEETNEEKAIRIVTEKIERKGQPVFKRKSGGLRKSPLYQTPRSGGLRLANSLSSPKRNQKIDQYADGVFTSTVADIFGNDSQAYDAFKKEYCLASSQGEKTFTELTKASCIAARNFGKLNQEMYLKIATCERAKDPELGYDARCKKELPGIKTMIKILRAYTFGAAKAMDNCGVTTPQGTPDSKRQSRD